LPFSRGLQTVKTLTKLRNLDSCGAHRRANPMAKTFGLLFARQPRYMDPLTIAAAGGIRARMESLDMLANNLANASTAGFKNDREFYSLYAAQDVSTLPLIEREWTDQSQGDLQTTGKPLDLALHGQGFFAVSGPSGPLYTRNGNFHLSSTGVVTTQEGYPLQLSDGRPLQLNTRDRMDVAPDGSVSQGGALIGKLRLTSFQDTSRLEKQGATYFRTADAAAGSVSTAEVRQGSLESSNVNSAESAVRLVTIMRQFEMLQKAVTIGGEMNRKAVEEVAKA